MRVYEVIVGNVGSVYHGKNRAEAIKTYRSYVRSSRELIEARCYGEDVNLLVDGETNRSTRVICGNSQYPSGGAGRRTGSGLLTTVRDHHKYKNWTHDAS